MATIYIVNIMKQKKKKSEEKGQPLSHFYIIDHSYTNLVCVCRSNTPLSKTAVLHNIQPIWLSWQPDWANEDKRPIPLTFPKIVIT